MKVEINSLKELYEFAKDFAKCLKGDEVILLEGTLSAGKTAFTKALVSAVEPSLEDEVNSPTFVVMNVYETKNFPIYHIDLYRVKEFDMSDILGTGVVIVEWANFQDFSDLNLPVVRMKIKIKDEEKRTFDLSFENADYLRECLMKRG